MEELTVKYELMDVAGPPHEPTFTYSVSLGHLVATGTGSSKRSARLSASQVSSKVS